MRLSRAETKSLAIEFAVALAVGAIAALVVPAAALARVDDALITFMSIVLAAVVPGVALTAAAQRPPQETSLGAERFGASLESQVKFWFGFLFVGGISVLTVLVSSALDWTLATPRPAYIPGWVPDGSAWLVLASVGTAAFTLIRVRHVANAVIDLIRTGTAAHVGQTLESRRALQANVDEALRGSPPTDPVPPIADRERRPRNPAN